jgi:hypothetical protein
MATAAAIPTRTRILFNEKSAAPMLSADGRPATFGELGPFNRPKIATKENNMKEQDRVLIRRGARELTPTEADLINGGLRTLTVCTIGGATAQRDGDVSLGEC